MKNAIPLWMTGGFAIVLLSGSGSAHAQIVPDKTLPVNSAVSAGRCTACKVINGGTVRGANLFHSFREFSVPTGGEAYFNNAVQIQNILTRVTGASVSNIDGLVRANGIANLYLLNPNGIVFGPNARLNIGGSFVATTADSFKFADGSEYSAIAPQTPPILSVNLTPGVQFGTRAPGSRVSNAGNLTVPLGQSLTLLGGTTTSTGTLTAPGGTVQVLGDRVALQDNARVDVSSPTAGGTVLIGGDYKGQGTVPNSRSTDVEQNVVIKADALMNGNGGKVIAWSDGNTRFDGSITAQGGVQGGNGGFVETSGKNTLTVGNTATVNTSVYQGQTGTWLLDPTSITIVAANEPSTTDSTIEDANARSGASVINNFVVQDRLKFSNVTLAATDQINVNAQVSASSSNSLTLQARTINLNGGTIILQGGGNITLDTTQNGGTSSETTQGTSILITGSGASSTNTGVIDTGVLKDQTSNGGNIQIKTGSLTLTNGAALTTSTFGAGNSGDIEIKANSLSMANGAALSASTAGAGRAGDVKLNLMGAVSLEGTGVSQLDNLERPTGIYNQVNGNGGNGGKIDITANSLSITNGGAISASTNGTGDAGIIKLTITGSAILDGVGQLRDQYIIQQGDTLSKIAQNFYGDDSLSIRTRISTVNSIENENVIQAGDPIVLPSRISTETFSVTRLNSASGQLSSKPTNSAINSQVNSENGGNAGEINITANSLTMENKATLSTSTFATIPGKGDAGNIILNVNTFSAASNSQITSETTGSGDAGNIRIYVADRLTLTGTNIRGVDQNTQISAKTGKESSGSSGNITISPLGSSKPTVIIQNGAGITVDSRGRSAGGNLEITTPGRITLDNGRLTAETTSTADGGNIIIDPDILLLRHSSRISTSAGTAGGAGGDGGNIKITAGFVVGSLLENSDIVANAFRGNGGRITINANGIFGFLPEPPRDLDPRFSVIDASSEFGISGSVTLNTLNIDPSQGLAELNLIPVDSSSLVASSCATGKPIALNENKFIVTRLNGLPASPDDLFHSGSILTELGTPYTPENITNTSTLPVATNPSSPPMVEAQGWIIASNGKVRLTAQAANPTPLPLLQPFLACPSDTNSLQP